MYHAHFENSPRRSIICVNGIAETKVKLQRNVPGSQDQRVLCQQSLVIVGAGSAWNADGKQPNFIGAALPTATAYWRGRFSTVRANAANLVRRPRYAGSASLLMCSS